MTVRALVVGVSTYLNNNNDLPFCKEDITAITNALSVGLAIKKEDIITLGYNGIVSKQLFESSIFKLQNLVSPQDTLIFYFSGHGGNIDEKNHFLCFSNGEEKTQDIIKSLDSLGAKNIIVFLDCCKSGNVSINEKSRFSSTMRIADMLGKGDAIISSSSPFQNSYPFDLENPNISLFTKFLCDSLTDRTLIRQGTKSLDDIKNLLFLYIEWWNSNPDHKQGQNPVFQTNIIGTIKFPVEQYTPYHTKHYYFESEYYIIYSVKPKHKPNIKNYALQIILKKPYNLEQLSLLNHEIIFKVKNLNIYQSSQEESSFYNKPANMVSCYFGKDESDILNATFLYHSVWVDKSLNKNYWYKIDKNSKILNGIKIEFNDFYLELKKARLNNTGTDENIIVNTEKNVRMLISSAENVIALFNSFTSKTITEDDFVQKLKKISSKINDLYWKIGDMDWVSNKLLKWKNACINISATIDDFTLIYNENGMKSRSFANRIACMNDIKSRYYQNLEELKSQEHTILPFYTKKDTK